MKVISATPLNPEPTAGPILRNPPQVIPIKSRVSKSVTRGPIFSNFAKDLPKSEQISAINYPKIPVVCIRNIRTPNYQFRTVKYSKCIPKVLEIKPLFHSRVKKCYKHLSTEVNIYKNFKSGVPDFDFMNYN